MIIGTTNRFWVMQRIYFLLILSCFVQGMQKAEQRTKGRPPALNLSLPGLSPWRVSLKLPDKAKCLNAECISQIVSIGQNTSVVVEKYNDFGVVFIGNNTRLECIGYLKPTDAKKRIFRLGKGCILYKRNEYLCVRKYSLENLSLELNLEVPIPGLEDVELMYENKIRCNIDGEDRHFDIQRLLAQTKDDDCEMAILDEINLV